MSSSTSEHPVDPSRRKWLRQLHLFLNAAVGVAIGTAAAHLSFSWIRDSGISGSLWASGAAATAALWKAAIDAVDTFRSTSKYLHGKDTTFDHVKFTLAVGSLLFGVVLGWLTLKNKPAITAPRVELVYVVSYPGKEAPAFLMNPTLVFASARLKKPSTDAFQRVEEISAESFEDRAVRLRNEQRVAVTRMLETVLKDCVYPGTTEPLKLRVYGFANDLDIRDGQGRSRSDSKLLNLAVANLRGQELYEVMKADLEKNHIDRIDAVHLIWTPWRNLGDMQGHRDNKVFRHLQIAMTPEIDQRSAVIVVEEPGSCPKLKGPNQGQGDI